MTNRIRVVAWLTMLVTASTLVAGCGEDRSLAEPSIGQVERTETVVASGMALVTRGEGVARLVGTLLNEAETPDRLVGIDVDTEIGTFDVVLADAPILLMRDEPVRLAREAEVTVISDRLRPGYRVKLALLFRDSAPIVTNVPVEAPTGPYADVEILKPPDGDIAP